MNIESRGIDMFEEFKQIDKFRKQFKKEFFEAFSAALENLYLIETNEKIIEYLDLMAEEAMSFTDAVIDKDLSYSDYRKEEELAAFSGLLEKQKDCKFSTNEYQRITFELNNLILKHYPAIYELSAFGYRLLDRNVKYYVCRFIQAIKQEYKLPS